MSETLTDREYQLLSDPNLLPSKFQIGEKIDQWLKELHLRLEKEIKPAAYLPRVVRECTAKISRGENYHYQAYRVLDYPRIYGKEAIFAFRTIVLWGHPIGCHLILSGTYKEQYQDQIVAGRNQLGDMWLAAQETPWIWEADAPGLLRCDELSEAQWKAHLSRFHYLKLSRFLPLSRYDELQSHAMHCWQQWAELLQ